MLGPWQMRDFIWPENGTSGRWVPLILKTRSVRDFANIGNHDRSAAPIGRETEPSTGEGFRVFGKRGRCAISLILEILVGGRFRMAGNGAIGRERYRLIGKRDRCKISLLSEIMRGARFHLAGKRNRRPVNDSVVWQTWMMRECANFGSIISEIMADARFHFGRKTEPLAGK